jgi:RNA polymerase sigma-70 factor (ECF subfamily)
VGGQGHGCLPPAGRSETLPGHPTGGPRRVTPPVPAAGEIEAIFRREYGRAVAVLCRVTGDLDAAEEAVAEAVAVGRWPETGVPPSPAGWIITRSRHKAVDQLRRESTRTGRQAVAQQLLGSLGDGEATATEDEEVVVRDYRLRLIFPCCQPAHVLSGTVVLEAETP